ncbi:RraA family protein [Poriferisphaera sp. WC338]|uniref:RraA family protein n=1 Tax=Poriferisphaera sp. WC338 TaxID=3425129 RepID=UPI003D8175B4
MENTIDHRTMLELKRWNTPTICNGLEQILTTGDVSCCVNIEETRDFMPQMGPMIGRAVTVVIEPSNAAHKERGPCIWKEYREYIASQPGPKIVVIQDLDKPHVYGSFWGEVNANVHRALGCVGTITDGAVRDIDEMIDAGFKAIAKRLCVSHAHACPVRWGDPVEVFGTKVHPGELVHADKHGLITIPREDEGGILEAARFMDSNECQTVIEAARSGQGVSTEQLLTQMAEADVAFAQRTREKFQRAGEFG